MLHRRTFDILDPPTHNLVPRKSTETIRWCEPGTQTYIILTMLHSFPRIPMLDILDKSIGLARQHAHFIGEVIPAGRFTYVGDGALLVHIRSSPHHQLTYEVTAAALSALRAYMLGHNFAAATFWIYDGSREVGGGLIGDYGN
ncbi:MAG: hypothetical protein Q9187_008197 [Circinaria calcarea]